MQDHYTKLVDSEEKKPQGEAPRSYLPESFQKKASLVLMQQAVKDVLNSSKDPVEKNLCNYLLSLASYEKLHEVIEVKGQFLEAKNGSVVNGLKISANWQFESHLRKRLAELKDITNKENKDFGVKIVQANQCVTKAMGLIRDNKIAEFSELFIDYTFLQDEAFSEVAIWLRYIYVSHFQDVTIDSLKKEVEESKSNSDGFAQALSEEYIYRNFFVLCHNLFEKAERKKSDAEIIEEALNPEYLLENFTRLLMENGIPLKNSDGQIRFQDSTPPYDLININEQVRLILIKRIKQFGIECSLDKTLSFSAFYKKMESHKDFLPAPAQASSPSSLTAEFTSTGFFSGMAIGYVLVPILAVLGVLTSGIMPIVVAGVGAFIGWVASKVKQFSHEDNIKQEEVKPFHPQKHYFKQDHHSDEPGITESNQTVYGPLFSSNEASQLPFPTTYSEKPNLVV